MTQGRGLIGFDGQPIDTRPLFPVLIAAAYKSFGISTASTFLTARIFFVGNVLLIYFVGQKFFNAWVGLVSSLLVLTSVSLNVWSTYIHLDHIMPFFMILAMLLTFIAHERRDYIWFGLVGATLALGYLLKEMTVLFFPLPILSFLWLKQYRRRQNLIGLGIFLIVLILMTLPWIGYVYYNSSMLGRAAGGGGIGLISNHLNEGMVNISSPLAIAHQILNAFLNYYRQFLQSNFILAPLFILAWVSAIVRAVWYHEKGSVFLTLALLLFSPMILFQGLAGFRDRLSMLLFLLSFIALGRFLIIIGQHGELLLQTYISDRPSSRALWRGLSVFLVAAPIFIQLKWEDVPAGTMEQFLNDFNTVQFVVHENTDWKFVQEASEHNARLAGEWFVNHASPEARILAGDQLLTSTYFYAQGNFLFFNLPFDDVDSLLNQSDVAWRGQKPLFLWLQKPPWILPLETPQLKQFRLYTLLENRFLEELTKRSVNYVMTDGRSNFLTLYLLDSPNFHKVAEFGHGTVNIFEVVSVAPSRFETHSDDQIPSFLNALSEQNPDRYRKITVSFFVTGLDWTPDQLQNLLSGNFSLLNLKRLVELEDYVALRSSYGPEGIPQAIAQHEEDARVQPKNPWPYVTLGALYEANGSLERSVEAYQYALSRDPNNIIIQVRLIQAYTKLAVKTESATAYRILNEIVNQALVVTPDDDELTAAILDSVRKVGPEHFETHVVAEMVSFYERTISQQPDKRQNYW
ncbi:MAG: glycosyltransferase family 39 protein, partial [Pseudomonadota bacterium]|nr:glycosyltransferase family 39 protein [Pseudomonadota bacterium]